MATPGTWDAGLREVRGPSAWSGGWRRGINLLWLVSVTDFRLTYFGTVLGYLWTLMRPLMLFGALYVVFTQIFRIGSDVPHYAAMLLFNIMLYTFFADATLRSVESVVAQEAVVRKTDFPRAVVPLSVVLTALFQLGLNLVAVFAIMLAVGVDPTWSWLGLPLLVGAIVVLAGAMSMMLSAVFVTFRDVNQIWQVLSTVLFYATPILYPAEFLPDELRFTLLINPLAPIFEQAHVWIIDPGAPGVIDAAGSWWGFVGPAAIAAGLLVAGVWTFARRAPHLAEGL